MNKLCSDFLSPSTTMYVSIDQQSMNTVIGSEGYVSVWFHSPLQAFYSFFRILSLSLSQSSITVDFLFGSRPMQR